ncbi:MAG: four helix bundle protein [Lachnospiraceae bacterium]|nr:four helix bundle protein [Lachnospiraceae bacterium]
MERKRGGTSELSVITKAKDLCSYILTVTEKSPKRFRFTLVSKLQNYALNLIENLYRANEVFLTKGDLRAIEKRREYQHQAMTECKLLSYMALVAREQGAILPKQYEQITAKVYDVQNLLGAWMKSDDKRMGQ